MPGRDPAFFLVVLLPCFFLCGRAFPETQWLAEEVVRYQRDPTDVVGSGTDPQAAWTFPEIIAAAEARLRVLGAQMERLS